jgi:hypothetical protein
MSCDVQDIFSQSSTAVLGGDFACETSAGDGAGSI